MFQTWQMAPDQKPLIKADEGISSNGNLSLQVCSEHSETCFCFRVLRRHLKVWLNQPPPCNGKSEVSNVTCVRLQAVGKMEPWSV